MGRACVERRRTGGDGGRGGLGMWLAQWWAAAEDATALSLEVFNDDAFGDEADDDKGEYEEREEEEDDEGERERNTAAATAGKTKNGGDDGDMIKVDMVPRGDGVKVDLVMAPPGPGIDANAANDINHHHHERNNQHAHHKNGGVGGEKEETKKRKVSGGGGGGSGGGGNKQKSYSRVIGVYARGSVARGEARAGVSDVDVVVVLWGDESAEGLAKLAREKTELREKLASPNHWLGRWGHLATKADLRVVTVPPPPHPAGAALAGAIAGNPLARQPPEAAAALAQCLGVENMFVLAAESATVFGPDLPLILPPSARRVHAVHSHADTFLSCLQRNPLH